MLPDRELQVGSIGGAVVSPIQCPFCKGVLPCPTDVTPQAVGRVLGGQILLDVVHDVRGPVSVVQNITQIIRHGLEKINDITACWLAEGAERMTKQIAGYMDHLRELILPLGRGPDFPLPELPALHAQLKASIGVDWAVEEWETHAIDGRLVAREYYRFLSVVAHFILLTVRRVAADTIQVAYEFPPGRLVGRATMTTTATADADGWNLVRLLAAVHGVPVTAETTGDTLHVRWEFLTR